MDVDHAEVLLMTTSPCIVISPMRTSFMYLRRNPMTIIRGALRPNSLRTALSMVLAICLATAFPFSNAEAQGNKPQMVVLALKARGGANLKSVVRKYFEKPMAKTGKVHIVSAKAFKKGARSAKVRGKRLKTIEGAKTAAQAAGATHLLVLQGTMERQGRKKLFYADVSLTDLNSGDVIFSGQYALKGRKLNKVTSANIIKEVYTSLEGAGGSGGDSVEEPPALEPEPELEPVDPPAAPEAPTDPASGGEGDAAVATDDPAPGATAGDEGTTAATEPGLIPVSEPSVVEDVPVKSRRRRSKGKVRPALQLVVGSSFLQRNGEVRAPNAQQTPPCYCGAEGESNPFFPAGYLAMEVYPLAFGGKGRIYEGIGLHMEAYYSKVKTLVNAETNETISSDFTGLRGGGTFRFVLWDSEVAPDIKLNFGASYFQFPLRQGAFPGVKYTGIYGGAGFDIPLMTPMVGLIGNFNYAFNVSTSGKTKLLGATLANGTIKQADGGIRLSFNPVEVRLLYKYEFTRTRYEGDTTLESSGAQFSNVRLRDRVMGFTLAVGVAL